MTAEACEWFRWIGSALCDECGQPPEAHRGLNWIDKSRGPLGNHARLHVAWEDYGPGRKLDVPLFTHYFGTPQFQGASATPQEEEAGP